MTYYCFIERNKLNKEEQIIFKREKPFCVEVERKLWFIPLPRKKIYYLELNTPLERQLMCDRAWFDKGMFMKVIKGVL